MSTNRTSWLKQKHYDNAPIKEAIIDVKIESSPALTLAAFERAHTALPPGYSERRKLMVNQLRGHMEEGVLTATATQDDMGYAFVGGEGKNVAQFRVDGFRFSRLSPYRSWDELRNETEIFWALYRQIVGDIRIVGVGLRYINQLDIPTPIRDFRDFVRVYPEVSADLDQLLAGFFMQVQIPQNDLGAMLILNESIVPPSRPDVVSVVLDIDLMKPNLRIESNYELWDILDALRLRKNLIFESCITNRTRELIS